MTTVEAVTFDCWGTLITDSGFERAMAARVTAIAQTCGTDEQTASDLLDRAWSEHHNAWVDGIQYGSEGIARFCAGELGSSQDVCVRLQEAFEEAGRLGSQHALPGARDTLFALKQAGVPTALVCDAGFTPGRIVRDFLDAHGLLELLDFCAFSNEIGVPKPHPRIFEAALEAIGTEPERTAHVGDLLRTDVEGARRIGMRTIRITAIGDDAARGFSWTPSAGFDRDPILGLAARELATEDVVNPYEDADAVVASHAELLDTLRDLGLPLPD